MRSSIALIALMVPVGAPGQDGYGLEFDGVDDYVRVENRGTFDFPKGFTVEVLVYPESPFDLSGRAGFKGLAADDFTEPPFSGGCWELFLSPGDPSDWGFSVCTPGCDAANSGPGGLVPDAWQHLAATFDGAWIRTYRDGRLVAERSTASPGVLCGGSFSPRSILFGTWETSFHGIISSVSLWSVTRTEDEIGKDLSFDFSPDDPALAGWWTFDEGQGQTTRDRSGRGNDGRLGSDSVLDGADPVWVNVSTGKRNAPFVRGDVDASGNLEVTDAVQALGRLFLGEPLPGDCLEAADLNSDGELDLTDAIYELGYLFLGFPPPAAPFPACGTDPSGVRFGCRTPTCP